MKSFINKILAYFKSLKPQPVENTVNTPIEKPIEKPIEPIIQPKSNYETIYETAWKELGTKEIVGSKNNPKVLEYHSATTLHATTDEIPWCSSFVSWVLEKSNVKSTKDAWARSYLNWGVELKTPVKGCVCVFERGKDSGHVGFFCYETPGFVWVLGGNQSNSVSVAPYAKDRLLGFRGLKI